MDENSIDEILGEPPPWKYEELDRELMDSLPRSVGIMDLDDYDRMDGGFSLREVHVGNNSPSREGSFSYIPPLAVDSSTESLWRYSERTAARPSSPRLASPTRGRPFAPTQDVRTQSFAGFGISPAVIFGDLPRPLGVESDNGESSASVNHQPPPPAQPAEQEAKDASQFVDPVLARPPRTRQTRRATRRRIDAAPGEGPEFKMDDPPNVQVQAPPSFSPAAPSRDTSIGPSTSSSLSSDETPIAASSSSSAPVAGPSSSAPVAGPSKGKKKAGTANGGGNKEVGKAPSSTKAGRSAARAQRAKPYVRPAKVQPKKKKKKKKGGRGSRGNHNLANPPPGFEAVWGIERDPENPWTWDGEPITEEWANEDFFRELCKKFPKIVTRSGGKCLLNGCNTEIGGVAFRRHVESTHLKGALRCLECECTVRADAWSSRWWSHSSTCSVGRWVRSGASSAEPAPVQEDVSEEDDDTDSQMAVEATQTTETVPAPRPPPTTVLAGAPAPSTQRQRQRRSTRTVQPPASTANQREIPEAPAWTIYDVPSESADIGSSSESDSDPSSDSDSDSDFSP
ncbi:hypothetical protein C8Q70DRAFT_1082814 [Cubamyces menziesii]|nr:hypothetical protein C8Q70DRAFT_1082814 [Cubamyces menziesii]